MAREAVIVNETHAMYHNAKIASNASVTAGTLMKMADPSTASASTGTGDRFWGILKNDKESNDFATTCTIINNCLADLYASGAITAGDLVKTAAGLNYVMSITAADSAVVSMAMIVGVARETASDGEAIEVFVFAK